MKELVEFIVKSLVDNDAEVNVLVEESAKEINVLVKVSEEDLGKVIGKGGKVANSIRTVARTCGKKQNKHVNIKFTDKK